ncbi:MAG: V-type ATPase subunit [Verrucomicrobiales bacterium]|nr:V-type ATPase subunit [Verrucomicrobiales bacterium]
MSFSNQEDAMIVAAIHPIDFILARAHGRYRRLGAPEQLIDLARADSIREFVRAAGGPGEMDTCADLENWLARDLAFELLRFARSLEEPGRAFMEWMALATRLEDFKTRVRSRNAKLREDQIAPHLVLASALTDGAADLREARGPWGAGFNGIDPTEFLATRRDRWPTAEEPSSTVRWELELDRAFLLGLHDRARRLPTDDWELVWPLVRQETDLFHLRVAFGLPPEAAGADDIAWREALHLPGSAIGLGAFKALLTSATHPTSAEQALRRVLGPASEELGAGPVHEGSLSMAEIERRAWLRFRQLAVRAFRLDPMSLGALAGYVVLRRFAIADQTQLAEGLRLGLSPATRRARLLQRSTREARHV